MSLIVLNVQASTYASARETVTVAVASARLVTATRWTPMSSVVDVAASEYQKRASIESSGYRAGAWTCGRD
ncbi:MAG: hypothetical protein OEW27_08720 [Aquincola sp.]|nr:hypothetical protein [Aquincola sp.]